MYVTFIKHMDGIQEETVTLLSRKQNVYTLRKKNELTNEIKLELPKCVL